MNETDFLRLQTMLRHVVLLLKESKLSEEQHQEVQYILDQLMDLIN